MYMCAYSRVLYKQVDCQCAPSIHSKYCSSNPLHAHGLQGFTKDAAAPLRIATNHIRNACAYKKFEW